MDKQRPDDFVELKEYVDPATGGGYFALPAAEDGKHVGELVIADGTLSPRPPGHTSPDPDASVTLTRDRFAAGVTDEWTEMESQQAAGGEARIVNGRFVFGPAGQDKGDEVVLPQDRFAALSGADVAEMRRLAGSGAASRYIATMQSTSSMPTYFPHDPGGIYLHTQPTRLGDEMHVVIIRNPSTGLYHAHLWAFLMLEDSELKVVNLNRWVGTSPGMSAHNFHLYPGSGRNGAVLCLSTRTHGGLPTLSQCAMRCAQWAAGMGEVVRGRPFPYAQ